MYENNDEFEVLDDSQVAVCVEIFSLLADATRLRIVLTLRDGEHSVGDIATQVGKSQAAVSQHLAKLRMSRLVGTRQDGNRIFYRLANDHATELIRTAIHQGEHAVGGPLSHADTPAAPSRGRL